MTKEELNTELDYSLCEHYGITMDELDSIPITYVRVLRACIFWGAYDYLNEQATDIDLWCEEQFPITS